MTTIEYYGDENEVHTDTLELYEDYHKRDGWVQIIDERGEVDREYPVSNVVRVIR